MLASCPLGMLWIDATNEHRAMTDPASSTARPVAGAAAGFDLRRTGGCEGPVHGDPGISTSPRTAAAGRSPACEADSRDCRRPRPGHRDDGP
jgi:hypothetical protein